MPADIRLSGFLSEGIAIIFYEGDQALWTRVKVRKATTCAATGEAIEVGDEAFRPVGNQQYRMRRISGKLMKRLFDEEGVTE